MEIKKSYFTRKLESNPDLAEKCEEVVRLLRMARIYINTRPDNYFQSQFHNTI